MHERRKLSAAQQASQPPLTMPNTFPARDREFITRLADDMHLSITWDEYDEDQNLVTWRFPGQLEEPIPEDGDAGEADDEEWEDEEEEESRIAVDRVLNKYEKAKVAEEDKEGDFDARYELSIKEKMDEWKRGYYKVCITAQLSCLRSRDCAGQTRDFLRRPEGHGRPRLQICRGFAVGHVLLLQRRRIVELVLQLPLCPAHFGWV